jgi:hypothetical protein
VVVAMDAASVQYLPDSKTLGLINARLKRALSNKAKQAQIKAVIAKKGTAQQRLEAVTTIVGLGDPASRALLWHFVQGQEAQMLTIVKTAVKNKQTIVFAWQPSASGVGFHSPRMVDPNAAIPVVLYSSNLHGDKGPKTALTDGYETFQAKHLKKSSAAKRTTKKASRSK